MPVLISDSYFGQSRAAMMLCPQAIKMENICNMIGGKSPLCYECVSSVPVSAQALLKVPACPFSRSPRVAAILHLPGWPRLVSTVIDKERARRFHVSCGIRRGAAGRPATSVADYALQLFRGFAQGLLAGVVLGALLGAAAVLAFRDVGAAGIAAWRREAARVGLGEAALGTLRPA